METNKVEQYFNSFIEENKLNSSKYKFLIAVSGGIDSITLLSLFIKSKLKFSVCSSNFNLRGDESKKDIALVEKICLKNKIKFYSKVFDTKNYSKLNKISIQMASRELRYEWFKEIMLKDSYNYLVTAHHSDDNFETIIFNLLKTTGYKGVIGIPQFGNKIIRPLLDLEKKDILEYAKNENLVWREDKSNMENKYLRNLIRNELIPIISKINPSFKKSVLESSKRMDSVEKFISDHLKKFINTYVRNDREYIVVDKKFMKKIDNYKILLYDYLSNFGFNYNQISLFIKSLESTESKRFYSVKYILINDRKSFYILKKSEKINTSLIINKIKDFTINSLKFSFKKYESKNFNLNKNKSSAQLDFDKIKFPLEIRNYRSGDKFTPLGMRGNKKISSFLSDNKVSFIEKINQLVLVDSNDEIIWLVGHQISEKFKVTNSTSDIIEFEII